MSLTKLVFKRVPYLLFFLFLVSAHAQKRYLDALFSEIKVETYTYSDTLQLDLYSPQNDRITDRPLLLLVHGGGFAIGKRDNPLEKEFCTTLAKKGYVVASMSYRLTRKSKSFGCDCPVNEKIVTFKEVTKDVLLATNYLRENASTLGFDPQKIVLMGSSAGAEAVLNTVYMRYHRDFKELPYDQLDFAGVISFAGAVLNAEYISAETAVPALLFHGANDKLVPFGTAPHHFCDDNAPGFLPLDGSKTIVGKLTQLDVPFILYQDPTGNHDWANLAYAFTNEVADFVKNVVLEKDHVQTTIRLTSTNK